MERSISALRDAYNSYRDALTAVLAEFHDAGSYRIQESAVLNLSEHHERFRLALKQYKAMQQEANHSATEEVAPLQDTVSQLRDCSVLSSKGQGDGAHVSGVLTEAVGKALADLDLEGAPVPKEMAGTDNTPAPEEAVVHQLDTSQVLPDFEYLICPACGGLVRVYGAMPPPVQN